MEPSSITIRPATYGDFCELSKLAGDEVDWEVTPEDFIIWRRYLPEESFLAAVDGAKCDAFIGFISCVRHGTKYGQISMFYIVPEHRGRGIGEKLFSQAMHYLRDRNVNLLAEPDMIDKYRERSGFGFETKWCINIADGIPCNLTEFRRTVTKGTVNTVPLTEDRLKETIGYVNKCCPTVDRSKWAENYLFRHPTVVTYIALDAQGVIQGVGAMGIVRGEYLHLAPLYAESEQIARSLMVKLLDCFENAEKRQLRYFYCSDNETMSAITSELGLVDRYTAQVMFNKELMEEIVEQVFCFSGSDVCFFP